MICNFVLADLLKTRLVEFEKLHLKGNIQSPLIEEVIALNIKKDIPSFHFTVTKSSSMKRDLDFKKNKDGFGFTLRSRGELF